MKKTLIIGAGPAGLTAAYELVKQGYKPIIIEKTSDIGGISKTVVHNGNRMDMGGHRFFTKSKKVKDFWLEILPVATLVEAQTNDDIMLERNRLSRILYLGKFFDYPITLSFKTIKNLGTLRMIKIGFSYIRYAVFPIRNEQNLEDFFINRFGKELYNTFFKDYTHKVWGVPCDEIPADWGA
jgi:protoporphyrinogen oxidase